MAGHIETAINAAIALLQSALTQAATDPKTAKATVQKAISALDPVFTNPQGPDIDRGL